MSHKPKKYDTETDTSLFLNMLADPSKLKPETKEINIERIAEETEGSELNNGINARVSARTFTSSESSKSSVSSVSTKSSESSKSSTSTKSSKSKNNSSTSRGNFDDYVNKYNNMNKEPEAPQPQFQSQIGSQTQQSIAKPYVSERDAKIYRMKVYFALEDMSNNGIKLTKDYTINSNLEEMEDELALQDERLKHKEAVMFGKDVLIKGSQWIERGNKWLDPIGARLNGWHKQMKMNIDNYDPVLKRLAVKYGKYITKVEPEIQLIWMFAGSAVAFHYTQKYIEEHGLQELAKERPELVGKIQSTIASVIEQNVGADPKAKEEKKPELSQAELYKRVQAMKQADRGEDEDDDQDDINNTISQMMGQNVYVPQTAIQPKLPPMDVGIQKPRKITELMSRANANNVISLNTETTNGVRIDTVDSESVDDVSMSQSRLRNRIKITTK